MSPDVLPFDIIALIIDIVGEKQRKQTSSRNLFWSLLVIPSTRSVAKHLFATVELHNPVLIHRLAFSKKGFIKLLKSRTRLGCCQAYPRTHNVYNRTQSICTKYSMHWRKESRNLQIWAARDITYLIKDYGQARIREKGRYSGHDYRVFAILPQTSTFLTPSKSRSSPKTKYHLWPEPAPLR